MSADTSIFVVIPAYNEAASIAGVVDAVKRFGTPLVVDDGSTDGTGERAEAAGAQVLTLARNAGYEGALDAGFAAASARGAEIIVTLDADGQFAPESVADLSAPILSGDADLVLGQRPESARVGEAVFNAYTRLRFGVGDILCGAKAYAIAVYRSHGRFDSGKSIATELALSALRRGVRSRAVPVVIRPREHGAPRFGSGLRANCRILYALWLAIRADLSGLFSARRGA